VSEEAAGPDRGDDSHNNDDNNNSNNSNNKDNDLKTVEYGIRTAVRWN